jgi:hypothetical protein
MLAPRFLLAVQRCVPMLSKTPRRATARAKLTKEATNARDVRWACATRYFWDQERRESEAAGDISTAFRLDDCLFAKLADFAQVPAKGIERLRQGVCCELSLLRRMHSKPPSKKEPGSNKRALIQLRRLAKFSRELSAIALSLDQQALKLLLHADYLRHHRAREIWKDSLGAFIRDNAFIHDNDGPPSTTTMDHPLHRRIFQIG